MSDFRQNLEQKDITPYHPLNEDGWKIIEGEPEQSVRIDHGSFEEGPLVAIWRCTPGVIEMEEMAFNEFVTIFAGRVVATLDGGAEIELAPGDSFYVPKGSKIRWDIKDTVSKFMLIAGSGPVI